MAEIASHADLQTVPGTKHHHRRRAEAAALTAPLREDPMAARLGVNVQRAANPVESAADRYAFYFFMGTITLGVLSMIVMAFTI